MRRIVHLVPTAIIGAIPWFLIPPSLDVILMLFLIDLVLLASDLILLMYFFMYIPSPFYGLQEALLLMLHRLNPELVRLLDRWWGLSS